MGANAPSDARSLVIMNHDIHHIGPEQVGPHTLRFKHRKKEWIFEILPSHQCNKPGVTKYIFKIINVINCC